MTRLPRPSTGFPWGGFPCFAGTMSSSDCTAVRPVGLRRLRPPVTVVRVWLRSRRCAARRRRAWACSPGRPARFLDGDDRLSQVPGGPRYARAPLFDPGKTSISGHSISRRGRPFSEQDRLSRSERFRGSITRLTHSLCTLRSRGHPRTTQHSVPAGGQPLPDRIGCLLGPTEGFRLAYFLLLQAFLAHSERARAAARTIDKYRRGAMPA